MFEIYPTNPEIAKVDLFSIKNKIELLQEYSEKIETVYQKEHESLWSLCKEENERTKDHEDDTQHDYSYSDSLRDIEYIYLRMHRYSSILAMYSYLESSMNSICSQQEKILKLPISVTDLKGDGIPRCKTYLEKLVLVDFQPINALWSRITTLNKLRNCIIHGAGDAEKMNGTQGLCALIENTDGLSFVEQKLVMMSKDFVLSAMGDIGEFLNALVKQTQT